MTPALKEHPNTGPREHRDTNYCMTKYLLGWKNGTYAVVGRARTIYSSWECSKEGQDQRNTLTKAKGEKGSRCGSNTMDVALGFITRQELSQAGLFCPSICMSLTTTYQ